MSLIYNNIEVEGVVYNGVEVQQIIYNGVELWSANIIVNDNQYTQALLAFDSATTTDEIGKYTWTNNGSPVLTTDKKVGTKSLYVADGYVHTTEQEEKVDFTEGAYECWFKLDSYTPKQSNPNTIILGCEDGGYYTHVDIANKKIAFTFRSQTVYTSANDLPLNKWVHLAYSYDINDISRLFIDGKLAWSGESNTFRGLRWFKIGDIGCIAHVDHFRASNICMYTSDFSLSRKVSPDFDETKLGTSRTLPEYNPSNAYGDRATFYDMDKAPGVKGAIVHTCASLSGSAQLTFALQNKSNETFFGMDIYHDQAVRVMYKNNVKESFNIKHGDKMKMAWDFTKSRGCIYVNGKLVKTVKLESTIKDTVLRQRAAGTVPMSGTNVFYKQTPSFDYYTQACLTFEESEICDSIGKYRWVFNKNPITTSDYKKVGSKSLSVVGGNINVETQSAFTEFPEGTWECWFKLNAYGDCDERVIMGRLNKGHWASTTILIESDKKLRWKNASNAQYIASEVFPLNKWTHIAFTYEKGAESNSIGRLFVDGKLISTGIYDGSSDRGGFTVGGSWRGGGDIKYDANFDSVQISSVCKYKTDFNPDNDNKYQLFDETKLGNSVTLPLYNPSAATYDNASTQDTGKELTTVGALAITCGTQTGSADLQMGIYNGNEAIFGAYIAHSQTVEPVYNNTHHSDETIYISSGAKVLIKWDFRYSYVYLFVNGVQIKSMYLEWSKDLKLKYRTAGTAQFQCTKTLYTRKTTFDQYTQALLTFNDSEIHDEVGKYAWMLQKYPVTTASQKKTGSRSLSVRNGNINVVDAAAFTDFTEATYECWFRLNSYDYTGDNEKEFLIFGRECFGHWLHTAVVIRDNKLAWRGNNSNDIIYQATSNFPLNQWVHIAFSYDSSNIGRLFLNGQLLTSAKNNALRDNGRCGFTIGGTWRGSYYDKQCFYDGYFDSVRISNKCRYTANFTPPASL